MVNYLLRLIAIIVAIASATPTYPKKTLKKNQIAIVWYKVSYDPTLYPAGAIASSSDLIFCFFTRQEVEENGSGCYGDGRKCLVGFDHVIESTAFPLYRAQFTNEGMLDSFTEDIELW